jgi:hypothetical protein
VHLKALRSLDWSSTRSAQDAATACNESVVNMVVVRETDASDCNDDNEGEHDDEGADEVVMWSAAGTVVSVRSGRSTPCADDGRGGGGGGGGGGGRGGGGGGGGLRVMRSTTIRAAPEDRGRCAAGRMKGGRGNPSRGHIRQPLSSLHLGGWGGGEVVFRAKLLGAGCCTFCGVLFFLYFSSPFRRFFALNILTL